MHWKEEDRRSVVTKQNTCVSEMEASGTGRLKGVEVEKVHELKYVGSIVQNNRVCSRDLKKHA